MELTANYSGLEVPFRRTGDKSYDLPYVFPKDDSGEPSQPPNLARYWSASEAVLQSIRNFAIVHDEMDSEIERAKQMLVWPDNWDSEGSMAYKESDFNSLIKFLRSLAQSIWSSYRKVMPIPEINPGPDGSFDMQWRIDDRSLLVNFPPSSTAIFFALRCGQENYMRGALQTHDECANIFVFLLDL